VAPPADDTHGWSRQPVVQATSRAELVVGGMGERVLVARPQAACSPSPARIG
jgi:hypothetical protein